MKLLLYCTKSKNKYDRLVSDEHYGKPFYLYGAITENFESLNGKIVAECDFEVEEHKETTTEWLCMSLRDKIIFGNMCEKASIDELKCYEYANGKPLYAIHIKNLHIFDKPRDITKLVLINQYRKDLKGTQYNRVKVAPQNMCMVDYAIDCNYKENIFASPYILISIQPQYLVDILNGKKTIEVRKKILKEMQE